MREVQVVDPLHLVVGEFVAQREAEAIRAAVVADQVDAADLGFFAAIEGKGRRGERLFRRDQHVAVAFIEPFRLHAGLALRGLAAFEAHAKHLHGVRQAVGVALQLGVHRITGIGAAEMAQAGAADQQVGRIGVLNWRQQAPAVDQ